MSELSDEIKTFIVKSLACYDTPSKVAEAVYVTFDVKVTRQQVHRYDPNCAQPPTERWCALHAATRQAFLADLAEIGVAHRNVRLRMLDRMARAAEERHNLTNAASLLEQAAKECGGIYDRTRPPSAPAVAAPSPADAANPQCEAG
jgi:hypothetical protein